jgi:cytochrome c oxidase assembly factor CtaG
MPVLKHGGSRRSALALVAGMAAGMGAGIGLPLPVMAHAPDAAAATTAAPWPLPWAFEPWVVACLLVSGVGYAVGVQRLWHGAGRGRGIRPWQVAAFAGGWLALAVALVSPLDPLGARLFSAHMLQHELMMVVAAPLLCLAQPLVAWTWALSPGTRRLLGRGTRQPVWAMAWAFITAPWPAWVLHAVVLWGWHVPVLFDRALADNGLHVLQHLSFLFSALLFWWSALRPGRAAQRGAALLSVFTTMLHTAALGALLALSDTPWYGAYLGSTAALGVDPLQDQQLGGLVMWVPAGVAYLAAGLALVARWLRMPPLQAGA